MDIWFVFAFSLFCLMCAWSFRFTQVVTSAYLPGSYDESVFQSGSFKFCSSTNSAWGFQFLHFLAKTCDWIQVPLLVIWFSNIFFWSMHVFSIFLMVSFEMPNLFYLNEAQLIFFFFPFINVLLVSCLRNLCLTECLCLLDADLKSCWLGLGGTDQRHLVFSALFKRIKDLYSSLWPEATPVKVCQQLS